MADQPPISLVPVQALFVPSTSELHPVDSELDPDISPHTLLTAFEPPLGGVMSYRSQPPRPAHISEDGPFWPASSALAVPAQIAVVP